MIFAIQENGRASFERISKNYSNYPTGLHPPSPPMDLTLQCFSSALIFFFSATLPEEEDELAATLKMGAPPPG